MQIRHVVLPLAAVLVLALFNVELTPSIACDNPVYRYALQNWPPAEFELLLVKANELADREEAAWQSLQKSASAADPRPNLRRRVVTREELAALPDGPMKDSLAALAGNALALLSPLQAGQQRVVWSGSCTADNAQRIAQSPAREEVGRRLIDGEAIVWIWLAPGGAGQLEQAENTLQDFLIGYAESLAAMEVPQAAGNINHPEIAPTKPPIDKSAYWPPRFSSLAISIDDPQEAVFIDMLKSSMQDRWPADEPVVFAVFGRGRVLGGLPLSQLNPASLRSACDFLTGACSCEVKDKNPGDDLLLAADWNSVSPDSASAGLISLVPLEPEISPDAADPVNTTPISPSRGNEPSAGSSVATTALKPTSTASEGRSPTADRSSPGDTSDSMKPLVGLGIAGAIVLVLAVFWKVVGTRANGSDGKK